jgi:hypothetical protein
MFIPGTNSIKASGYEVANSCMFNQPDSASLNKTFGTPTDSKKLTISFWFKLMAQSGNDHHAFSNGDANADESLISFINSGNHNLEIKEDVSSSPTYQLVTNRIFRDPSAFYHIVVAFDTTQGTAANRLKLYINGTQETSFATESYPSGDQAIKFNTAIAQYIGKRHRDEGAFFNGYMAEVVFIDGTQYAASDFGEFDADSPTIWKPKDPSGLTFGTNGFYCKFSDSANLGEDSNGGTDLTEVNLAATDQATDTPTNNGNVHNALIKDTPTLSEGNLNVTTSVDATWETATGTIGVNSAKWYCEYKVITKGSSAMFGVISMTEVNAVASGKHIGDTSLNSLGYGYNHNGNKYNNGSYGAYGDGYVANDIISIALDLDNNKLYFAKNGTWQNSGDPTTGATGTGSAYDLTAGYYYTFGCSVHSSSDQMSANFGSPSYANSSDAADANGYGAFEFAPPSGYYALCTKNLAEFG